MWKMPGRKTRKLTSLIMVCTIVVISCTTSSYFIPPHSTPTNPNLIDIIKSTGATPEKTQEISNGSEINHETPTQTVSENPNGRPDDSTPYLYYTQAADTLPVIAIRFRVEPSEITSTEPIPGVGFINPGQLLLIPRKLQETTSSERLIPDSEVIFSPTSANFDVEEFVDQAGGKLSQYSEWLQSSGLTSGADVISRVAVENSINPRLLLALLEYQSGWVYGVPSTLAGEKYPMGNIEIDKEGLFRQLSWAVNQISTGYYGWREGRRIDIRFIDGISVNLSPELNSGTVALMQFFSSHRSSVEWSETLNQESGFPALYEQMFGDPWRRASTVEPIFPPGIEQPDLVLPFEREFTWSLTGGPHGAWEHDGAYAALDFAPSGTQSGCVPSYAWVLASASGQVVRSGNGVLVLDLDGDGSEHTGWVLVYLHITRRPALPVGTWVDVNDTLGHPSCEGGVSTGTHLHMARKYNGEWIPADGPLPFNLGGWVAQAGDEAYQGKMIRGDDTVLASIYGAFHSRIIRGISDP